MGLLQGKKGVIMGIANSHSIAAGIAKTLHAEGAELAYSHLPDRDERGRMERRVRNVVDALNPALVFPCDVTSDEDVQRFFGAVGQKLGRIDFVVHSIAYAPLEDIRGPLLRASRAGFKEAMDISVYSLVTVARAALEIMAEGGAICAMTYLGGEKVIPGYNMMGVCKAALDMTVKYLAYDLGAHRVRVNALSSGPIKTLASSAVGDFKEMLKAAEHLAPLGRGVTLEDVGRTALYLVSDLSQATTGEIHHVDCGYNILGAVPQPRDLVQAKPSGDVG